MSIIDHPEKRTPFEDGILKDLEDDLPKSERTLIVLMTGPIRTGKSTSLNHLTVKGYPLLNKRGGITQEARKMMHFEAKGDINPCTTRFKYIKVRASEFMRMHGLGELSTSDDDYDIYFIDTEGMGNIFNSLSDLFFGVFSLIKAVGVLLYFDQSPMSNADRVKNIGQSIVMLGILGSESPKICSIMRGGNFDVDADDNDESEGEDDPKEEEWEDTNKYNEKLYNNFRKQDEKNKGTFIRALKKEAIIDEKKISILTMPNCVETEGVAFERTMSDLSKIILEGSTLRSGTELLELIHDGYKTACTMRDVLIGQPSTNTIYINFLKEFCQRKIKDEENAIEKMDTKSISDLSPSFAYDSFEEELKKFIPDVNGLDPMLLQFLKDAKSQSEDRMERVIRNKAKIENNEDFIYRLYEANNFLYAQRPNDTVSIDFIDKDGNTTGKVIDVLVSPEKFIHDNGKKRVECHYLIPTGIKVQRMKTTITNNYVLGFSISTNKERHNEDVTNEYYFDFMTTKMRQLRSRSEDEIIGEKKDGSIENDRSVEGYFGVWRRERIVSTKYEVHVNEDCEFKEVKCEFPENKDLPVVNTKSNTHSSAFNTRGVVWGALGYLSVGVINWIKSPRPILAKFLLISASIVSITLPFVYVSKSNNIKENDLVEGLNSNQKL